jgi:hypothetical protein
MRQERAAHAVQRVVIAARVAGISADEPCDLLTEAGKSPIQHVTWTVRAVVVAVTDDRGGRIQAVCGAQPGADLDQ